MRRYFDARRSRVADVSSSSHPASGDRRHSLTIPLRLRNRHHSDSDLGGCGLPLSTCCILIAYVHLAFGLIGVVASGIVAANGYLLGLCVLPISLAMVVTSGLVLGDLQRQNTLYIYPFVVVQATLALLFVVVAAFSISDASSYRQIPSGLVTGVAALCAMLECWFVRITWRTLVFFKQRHRQLQILQLTARLRPITISEQIDRLRSSFDLPEPPPRYSSQRRRRSRSDVTDTLNTNHNQLDASTLDNERSTADNNNNNNSRTLTTTISVRTTRIVEVEGTEIEIIGEPPPTYDEAVTTPTTLRQENV